MTDQTTPQSPRDDLQVQTDYSAHLLTELYRLLTCVRRVDQKYGPFDEFTHWREDAQAGLGLFADWKSPDV